MLLAEEDDYMFLSPAGEAFYRAFQQRMAEVAGTPILLSQRAWETYERMTEEHDQVRGYLERLRLPEWRRRNSEQPANADCFVVPRGHIDLRLLYYEAEDGIRVLEILRHGEYERKLKQGISRSEYSDFKRLP
jgi:hypothetical protein